MGGRHRRDDENGRAWACGWPNASTCARSIWPTIGARSITRARRSRRNFLVTLHRAASRALTAAGAPAEALLPLMQRTIDNGFDLTGPIARGDRATVDAHLAALAAELPDLEPMYRALAEATRR